MKQVLLLADGKVPPEGTHWKTLSPKLEESEMVRNFYHLGSQGSKHMFHCLIDDTNGDWDRIRTWIQNNPVEGIQWWVGDTAKDMYRNLWQNNNTIAKKVLRYQVETTHPVRGGTYKKFVSVEDAEQVYGETIDTQKIKAPHVFSGDEGGI